MSTVTIAPPENLQIQSPLVRLPAEIKHIICGYCFRADGSIVDPVIGCARLEDEKRPALGLNLLRTCRRVYHDADLRPLFHQNTFRFTTVDRARAFLRSLGEQLRSSVQDIEIDARRVHSDHPAIAREWLHYLAWGCGPWAKLLGSLREDAPGLQCLRLNFSSWPVIPMFRAELWNLLRSLLLNVEGLERIVVIGASKGLAMAKREPWSPMHYVGSDDVGSDDLVQRMWHAVGHFDDHTKIIKWTRGRGGIRLEVVTRDYLTRVADKHWPGFNTRKSIKDPWPESGSCSWFAYQNRDLDVLEPTIKGINPSAAE